MSRIRMRVGVLVCALLAAALGTQLWLQQHAVARARSWAETPMLPGDTMRGAPSRLTGEPFAYPRGCWVAYVASVRCPACTTLAATSSASAQRASAFWLFPEQETEDVRTFANATGISLDSVLILPTSTLEEAGFFATPTAIFGAGARIDAMHIALTLVDTAAVARACGAQ